MKMNFKNIPQLTTAANYRVNQPWICLEETLENYQSRYLHLDLDPEFQRGHVWTEEQQIAYVEFKLKGGFGSNELQFNCAGWMDDFRGPFVLVDGKQRLNAVLRFLRSEIPAFNTLYKDFEGRLPHSADFLFCVNNLKTMRDVYRWYLELNSGGTPHTQEELDRVRKMLEVV